MILLLTINPLNALCRKLPQVQCLAWDADFVTLNGWLLPHFAFADGGRGNVPFNFLEIALKSLLE